MKKAIITILTLVGLIAIAQQPQFGILPRKETLETLGAASEAELDTKVDSDGGSATNLNLTTAFYLSYESETNYVQWTYNTTSNRVEIIEVENGTTNTYYDLTD